MKHLGLKALVAAFAIVSATAQAVSPHAGADRKTDEVIPNWDAPKTWTPLAQAQDPDGARQDADAAAKMGLRSAPQPLIVTPPTPILFVPVTPCRLIDTRAGSGFPAGYGPPSLTGGGTQRTFVIAGQCGIPSGAQAVSFNFAVWFPTSRGDIRVFPGGTATPTVSTLNWEPGLAALANAAVVPLGAAGDITIQMDATAALTDIFVDVNGYYGPTGTLPHGTVTNFYTKTAGVDYFYPVTITLPTGGACMVLGTVQFNSNGTAPTGSGPYFRFAIKRGAAADTNDGQHGNYFTYGANPFESVDMTRHHNIDINPNEATQIGCYLSSTSDANWQTGLYCKISYLCY